MNDTQVNTGMLEQLDKIQRLDHDTITRLEATSNAFFLQFTKDIKFLSDNLNTKNVEHEFRLKALEKVQEEGNPLAVKDRVDTLWQDRSNRAYNNRFIVVVASIISTTITIIITMLAFTFKIFPINK